MRRYLSTTKLTVGLLCVLGSVFVLQPAMASTAVPEAGSSDWQSVTAGSKATCGLTQSGRLYCWGSDRDGQLGDNRILVDSTTPVPVEGVAATADWASVSVGGMHTCAIRTSGRLYCWGQSDHGALGDAGGYNFSPTPTEVAGRASNWASVSAGFDHTCAIKTSGRLFCWGFDFRGQLGNDSERRDRHRPTEVAGHFTNWQSVSAEGLRTCAIRSPGRLYCWGSDSRGALGDGGPNRARPTPVRVGAAADWASVAVEWSHTCGLRTTGHLFCWGDDTAGALGNNAQLRNRNRPVEVAGHATDWTSVTLGFAGDEDGIRPGTTCAVKITGRLFCWGSDVLGMLGNGGADTNRPVPTEIAGNATDWAFVDAGSNHVCAVKTTDLLYCWGSNLYGQLGDGSSRNSRAIPVEVAAH